MALEKHDNQGDWCRAAHKGDDCKEPVNNSCNLPFFAVAGQYGEILDDLQIFPSLHCFVKSVNLQNLNNAGSEERQKEKRLIHLWIRVLLVIELYPKGVKYSRFCLRKLHGSAFSQQTVGIGQAVFVIDAAAEFMTTEEYDQYCKQHCVKQQGKWDIGRFVVLRNLVDDDLHHDDKAKQGVNQQCKNENLLCCMGGAILNFMHLYFSLI